MYRLVRSVTTVRVATQQIVAFTVALLLAEAFYKFGSFLLELVAFLATWAAVDAVSGIVAHQPDETHGD